MGSPLPLQVCEPFGRDEARAPPHISENRWGHIITLEHFHLIDFPIPRNPNGEGLPHWPAYDQQEGYLQIGVPTQVAHKLKDDNIAFWTELFRKEAAKKPPHTEHIEL